MNGDDIIRMAREAGLVTTTSSIESVKHFAALVAAAEREACALDALTAPIKTHRQDTREACAAAIRARGT